MSNGPGGGLDELRALILGNQRIRAEDIAQHLAEAVTLRQTRDGRLKTALQPILEEALRISVQKNPRVLAEALFPVMGSAIRRSVAAQMQAMMDSLNQALEASVSWRGLAWRIEAWRTGRTFAEVVMLRSLLFRVRDVFLIHRETGLSLAHRTASESDSAARDSQLVPAMLTAIDDFVHDSFSAANPNRLERVQAGDIQLWIAHGPNAVLAGVVQGIAPPGLASVFEQANERIHQQLSRELTDFNGNCGPFLAAHPMLDSCLLGAAQLETPSQADRRGRWIVGAAITLIGLTLLAAAGWVWREYATWRETVESLSSQPGIVVVRSEWRPWGQLLEGLRDPLSTDPAIRMASWPRATARWQPFHSLEPSFIAQREQDAAVRRIESARAVFETGSDQPEDLNFLAITPDIGWLHERSPTWRIEIHGQADPAGEPAYNAALAQRRADNILRLLTERGVPAEYLSTKSAPVRTARLVTFEVIGKPARP